MLKKTMRKVAIKLLELCGNRDGHIRHSVTHDRFLLNFYKHRNYWYQGAKREAQAVEALRQLVHDGDTVFDLGGHIGYTALLFRSLVGSGGKIWVFEPDEANLRYLNANTSAYENILVVPKVASDVDADVPFYVEGLSGQNSSIYSDFDVFRKNAENAGSRETYRPTTAESLRIDTFASSVNVSPDFVKIDVEGAELTVLQGMARLIGERPPGASG